MDTNSNPMVYIEIAPKDGAFFQGTHQGDICVRAGSSAQSIYFGSGSNVKPTFRMDNSNIFITNAIGIGNSLNSNASLESFNVNNGNALFNSNVYVIGKLGVGTTTPSEVFDISSGNARISSNLYTLGSASFGMSSELLSEVVDIGSNLKVRSNAYVMRRLAVASSNPTETLDVFGTAKISSSLYALNNVSIGSSNPREMLDVSANIIVRSNAYVVRNIGIGTSNPTEALDVITKAKVRSDMYVMGYMGIGNSNPTERLDVFDGNARMRCNLYVGNSVSIGSNIINPTETLDVRGNTKINSNLYVFSNVVIGGSSNPTEMLDVTGNIKTLSNVYAMNRMAVGTSNPIERFHVDGNIFASSNIYAFSNLGVGTTLPSERIENVGNTKLRGNVYMLNNVSIAHSNPTEALDIRGNEKISSNLYVMQNIGIRTSNPQQPLHVIGNARIEGNLDVLGIYNSISTDVQITDQFTVSNNGTGPALNVYQMGAEAIADFYDDTTLAVRIADGGKVGVNTADPVEKFHVVGKSYTTQQSLVSSNDDALTPGFSFLEDSNTGMFHASAAALGFSTGGQERVRITDTGAVGIGTSTPTSSFTVIGDSLFSNTLITYNGTTTHSNELNVSGATTLCNTLNVSGATVLSNTFTTYNGTTVHSNALNVSGPTTLCNTLNVSSATILSNALTTYNGPSTFSNNVIVSGVTTLSNSLNVYGRIALCNALNVSGPILLSNTLITYNGTTTHSNALNVSGVTSLCNNLNVSSPTVLSNSLTTYNGPSTFSNDVIISGETTLNSLSVTGAITFRDTLNVSGTASLCNTLNVVGATTLCNTLNVASNTVLSNALTTYNGPSTFSNNVIVSGTTILSNQLNVSGATTLSSNLNVLGPIVLSNAFTTTNGTTIHSNALNVSGATTLCNTLNVSGTSTLSNVNVSGITTFSNTLNVSGAITLCNTFNVSGTSTLSNVNVSGITTLSNTLNVTGATTLCNTLNVSGTSTVSNLTVTGTATLSNGLSAFNGTSTFSNNVIVFGNTTLSNTLITYNGTSTFSNNVIVTGIASLCNNVNVGGVIQGSTITSLSNLGLYGSNTVNSLSNYVYSSVQGGAIGAQTTADYASNTANWGSNTAYAASNRTYRTWNVTNSNVWIGSSSNLGIGTTTPAYRLHVEGESYINGPLFLEGGTASYNPGTAIDASNLTQTYITFGPNGAQSDYAYLRQIGGNNTYMLSLDFHDDGDDAGFMIRDMQSTANPDTSNVRFLVNRGGNVGVGTSNPSERFHVVGKMYANTQVLGASNDSESLPSFSFLEDSNTGIFHPSNDAIGLTTNGTEKMRIRNDGNIGIGITNPTTKLDVNGNIRGLSATVYASGGTPSYTLSNSAGFAEIGIAAGASNFSDEAFGGDAVFRNVNSNGNGKIFFQQGSGTSALCINSNNTVGIGTPNPIFRLDVTGSARISNCVVGDMGWGIGFAGICHCNYASSAGVMQSNYGFLTGNDGHTILNCSNNSVLFFRRNNVNQMVLSNTNLGIGTTFPVYKFDVRGNIGASNILSFSNMTSLSGPTLGGEGGTGDRIILYPGNSTTHPYSIGMSNFVLWQGVPTGGIHRWYLGSNIGMTFSNNRLAIGNTTQIGAAIEVEHTGTGAIVSATNSNMVATDVLAYTVGQSTSCNNAANFRYSHSASNSSNNFVGIGFWGNDDLMVVRATGNVGIGTKTPSSRLHVVGNTQIDGPLSLATGSNLTITGSNWYGAVYFNTVMPGGSNGLFYITRGGATNPDFRQHLVIHSDSDIAGAGVNFATNGATSRMFIDSQTGNVGIGLTTPASKLEVQGNIRAFGTISVQGVQANFGLSNSTGYGDIGIATVAQDFSTSAISGDIIMRVMKTTGRLLFQNSSNAAAICVNSNNNVGIGTDTPNNAYKLHVAGKLFASDDIIAFSDKRLKYNLNIINDALPKLHRLTGYTFDTNTSGKTRTGLLAQEVLDVLPEAVYKNDDGYYSLAYGNMAGLFVEAIKELDSKYSDKIAKLEAVIDDLKAKLT